MVFNVNIVYETSSLRTRKIMPSNLNEIVRSWVRIQDRKNPLDEYRDTKSKK